MTPLLPDPDLTPPERPAIKLLRRKEAKVDMLKKAIGIVLLGGSAAWAGGEYAAREVQAEVKLYAQRERVLEDRVRSAEQSAIRAETMLEMLLKKEGIVAPPRNDAGAAGDAGDAGAL